MDDHALVSETVDNSCSVPPFEMFSASETRSNSRSIPHDVMLEILSRLPGRSLVRFKGVCKQWNSLFHNSHFVSQQLNHAAKNPSCFLSYSCPILTDQLAFYSFKIKAGKAVVSDKFTVPAKKHDPYRISNTCNGLIAFCGNICTYVVNPCTREWVALPKATPHMHGVARWSTTKGPFLGLGFSTATGKYKIVRIFYRDRTCWACEVLTLGTDRSWRSLGDLPYPVTTFEPAYTNGHIYWTINSVEYVGPECILSFDVCHEKFMTIQLPQRCPGLYGAYCHFYLNVLGGSVCPADLHVFLDDEKPDANGIVSYLPVMHIHVLKNHEDCIWMKGNTLRLAPVFCQWKASFSMFPPAIQMFPVAIQNGKVFLLCPYKTWRLHELHTGTCYNIELPRLKELSSIQSRGKPFACVESIVPIECLKY